MWNITKKVVGSVITGTTRTVYGIHLLAFSDSLLYGNTIQLYNKLEPFQNHSENT